MAELFRFSISNKQDKACQECKRISWPRPMVEILIQIHLIDTKKNVKQPQPVKTMLLLAGQKYKTGLL